MLSKEIQTILEDAGKTGWVVEPEAKKLLSLAGLNVPRLPGQPGGMKPCSLPTPLVIPWRSK